MNMIDRKLILKYQMMLNELKVCNACLDTDLIERERENKMKNVECFDNLRSHEHVYISRYGFDLVLTKSCFTL